MIDPLDRTVRAIARWNSYALVWAQFGIAHLVMLGGIGLLRLYQPMSTAHLLVLIAVSQSLVAIDNLVSVRLTLDMWRPVRRWEAGARDEASVMAAWEALATLPLEYLQRMRRYPLVLVYLPFIAFATWELGLRWYSFLILAVVGTVVLAYGLIVRYFTMEVVVRPVLEELAPGLPSDFEIGARGLPLRWRLLAVAPAINCSGPPSACVMATSAPACPLWPRTRPASWRRPSTSWSRASMNAIGCVRPSERTSIRGWPSAFSVRARIWPARSSRSA